MARVKKSAIEAVELEEGDLESPEPTEETVEVVEAIAAPKAEKAPKLERFILSADHSCVVGGKEYSFRKGVEEKAPEHVVNLLRRAKLIAVELK